MQFGQLNSKTVQALWELTSTSLRCSKNKDFPKFLYEDEYENMSESVLNLASL